MKNLFHNQTKTKVKIWVKTWVKNQMTTEKKIWYKKTQKKTYKEFVMKSIKKQIKIKMTKSSKWKTSLTIYWMDLSKKSKSCRIWRIKTSMMMKLMMKVMEGMMGKKVMRTKIIKAVVMFMSIPSKCICSKKNFRHL